MLYIIIIYSHINRQYPIQKISTKAHHQDVWLGKLSLFWRIFFSVLSAFPYSSRKVAALSFQVQSMQW